MAAFVATVFIGGCSDDTCYGNTEWDCSTTFCVDSDDAGNGVCQEALNCQVFNSDQGDCAQPADNLCTNTCGPGDNGDGTYANDGACDDSGTDGAGYCEYGTDCGDCGARPPL